MSEEKTSKKVSIWAYILIGAAGLGILMFDIPNIGQSGSQTIAKIGDRDISLPELNNAVSRLQSQLPDLPPETLQRQALHHLARQALLEQHALDSNFTYPDAELHNELKREFGNDEAYQTWLRQRNISAAAYQESLRRSGTIGLYYQTLAATAPKDDILFTALLDDLAQTHDYTAVRLPLAPAAQALPSDENAIKAWYDAHPDAFMTPEKVSVRYIILDRAKLADTSTISEEALAAKQRANERRAGQYLIFDERSAADSAAAAIAAGDKTFDDLAADIRSGKIAGETGDLPLQQHGKGIDPVVDDALFALTENGDISPVLSSANFNAMLLTLTERQQSDSDARSQLATEAAEARYGELAEKAFDAALGNKPLSQIADITGQPIETADDITATSAIDWLANAKIQISLFGDKALETGKIGEPVELDPGRSIFYEISNRTLPELRPYSDVQTQAEAAWRADTVGKTLDEQSAAIAEAWRSGGDVNALISQYGGERQQYQGINRLLPSTGIDPEIANSLMQQSEAIHSAITANGDRLITHLDTVHPGDSSTLPADMHDLLKTQWQISTAQENENATANWLQQHGNIKIYEDRLPQP